MLLQIVTYNFHALFPARIVTVEIAVYKNNLMSLFMSGEAS